MARYPRPIRPLPGTPAPDAESGLVTGLVARIVIVATIILGQLWALTVALEESLLDNDTQAWMLAGFSMVSFVVVLVLSAVEPPPRDTRRSNQTAARSPLYVSRPVDERPRP